MSTEDADPLAGDGQSDEIQGASPRHRRRNRFSRRRFDTATPLNIDVGPLSFDRLASRASRLGAFLVDLAAAWIIGIIGYFVAGSKELTSTNIGFNLIFSIIVANGLYCIAQVILLTAYGQTLGKRAVGIRIVRYDNGGNPGFGRAVILRLVFPYVITVVLSFVFIGPLFILADILFIFREDRRCLHDWIAGTKVIRV